MQQTIADRIRNALHLRRAFQIVWTGAHRWTLASALLTVFQGLLPVVALYVLKLVIDAVTLAVSSADPDAFFPTILTLLVIGGALSLLTILAQSLSRLVSEAHAMAVTDHVQNLLHAKSVTVDLEYYESPHYFDALYRAQREAPYRPTRIVNGLVTITRSGVALVAMAGLLFACQWWLALVLLAAALPAVFARVRYAKLAFERQKGQTSAERRADYFHWLMTSDGASKEIRLFDLGPLFIQRYRELRDRLRHERIRMSTRRFLGELLPHALSVIALFASYAYIAYRAMGGNITLGDMVMYLAAFQRGQAFLRDILRSLAGLYEDNLFLAHLDEFLGLEPKVMRPRYPVPVPDPMKFGINIENVSFQYPDDLRKALEDINLTVRPGEVIALVGRNGSGKTTLVKLLCRFYDPSQGTIAWDGSDLRQFEPAALRRNISVLFQDFTQYNLSARENIWLGNTTLSPESGRIREAAQHADIEETLSRLRHGHETVLGRWFEEGEQLSIGEWQKIALARAFMREAQLFVLDEPTSSLDAKTEYEVFKGLRTIIGDRCAVLVSHRFSTVRTADRIYVLDHGKIVESGSHDELLVRGGLYSDMFNMQAEGYR